MTTGCKNLNQNIVDLTSKSNSANQYCENGGTWATSDSAQGLALALCSGVSLGDA